MRWIVPEEQLVAIESPHLEPRLAFQALEPRKVNDLTLIDGKTFLSTSVAGDIMPPGAPDVGLFYDDSRYLSHLELRVGGQRTVVLSSSTDKSIVSQIELTTGNIALRDSYELPENTIHIRREQLLANDVFFDRLSLSNFNLQTVDIVVEIVYDADFVDVFQVRGVARSVHGQHYKPVVSGDGLSFYYRGLDDRMRSTEIKLSPAPDQVVERTARWELRMEPGARLQLLATIIPRTQSGARRTTSADFTESLASRREAFEEWQRHSTRFDSSNDVFDETIATASGDFYALRIPDAHGGHIIAAGVPWFATPFGRDSLIAAYQTLPLNPQLAIDTLRILAAYQGKEVNDWRDEQPGKILHEYRTGEMTNCGELPFGPYYGSVDATPLFLILLSETWKWTADENLVRELLPAAHKALDWIEQYGDLDGDGFVEYERRSAKGLANQGWKDSWDANLHSDGTLAVPPIALVEVQGYVYEAQYRMASLLRSLGDNERAERLRRQAVEMVRRIEKSFYIPELGYYAMALDGQKRPLQVISSNAGHLLFTRAISAERARAVANRLMQPDMFSGWGWRTIARTERIYNPLSYHRGSVWPHDNSLVAHGLSLYDLRHTALRTLTGMFQAALNFRDYRLPELFCGVHRRDFDRPVQYPVSCSPQAWASGSWFLMLSSVLGIRPHAPKKELNIINPQMPDWLERLHIQGMRVGDSRVGLEFTRRGERSFCNVVDIEGDKLLVNVAFRKT